MKKSGLLKVVLVIVLSLLLVANITSVVFADDVSSAEWEDPMATTGSSADATGASADSSTGSTTDGTTATGTSSTDGTTAATDSTSTGTDTTDTSSSSSLSTGSATTTLDSNENEEGNEVNSLAYTGIENTNFLAIVIVIGAIVAGYSLRKLREYNNI